jgi:hypothetical protein
MGLIKKHLSRRELVRRMEQGRLAMRVLAAAILELGGTLRVKRDTFESMVPETKCMVDRDAATGDLILRTGISGRTPKTTSSELTFAEIQERYGKKADASVEDAPDAEA